MRKILAVLLMGAMAASCGGKKEATGATDDDGNPVAASATQSLGAEATSSDAAPAPVNPAGAQTPTPPAADGETALTNDDEKLATGQFYDAYPLPVQADETIYIDIKSAFKPVLVILDPNKQKLSESTALTQNADGSWSLSFSDDFKEAGGYYVIIAAETVGATGAYSTTLRRGRKIG